MQESERMLEVFTSDSNTGAETFTPLVDGIVYTVFQKKWRQNLNRYNYGISYQN